MPEPAIHFEALNLASDDVEATVAFYRLLGIEIPDEGLWRTPTGAHHVSDVRIGEAYLSIDSHQLADVYNAGHKAAPKPGAVVLGFRLGSRRAVDDLHATVVAAGHASRQEPYDAFWGARYAIVEDPDGREVGLMSPVDPDRATGGPDL